MMLFGSGDKAIPSLSSLIHHLSVILLLIIMVTNANTTDALQQHPVAVIGATGRLGRLAVQELIDRGIPCRLLVRKMPPSTTTSDILPKSLEDCQSSEQVLQYFQSIPNVSLIHGDVSNVPALQELVQDCSACLGLWGATRMLKFSDIWNYKTIEDTDPSHAKQVNYYGVRNLIQACQVSKSCHRIVRITGKGENPTQSISIFINLFGSMAKAWNYQGEQALREASASTSSSDKIEYTIVRPGIMSNDAPGPPNVTLQLADDGGELPTSKIRYQDVASLCVESLEYDNAANCTLTAMTKQLDDIDDTKEMAVSTWKPLLSKIRPDRRKFPSDMLERHYAAVRGFLFKSIGSMTAVVLAIAVKIIWF